MARLMLLSGQGAAALRQCPTATNSGPLTTYRPQGPPCPLLVNRLCLKLVYCLKQGPSSHILSERPMAQIHYYLSLKGKNKKSCLHASASVKKSVPGVKYLAFQQGEYSASKVGNLPFTDPILGCRTKCNNSVKM
jgi:hypothetical protein